MREIYLVAQARGWAGGALAAVGPVVYLWWCPSGDGLALWFARSWWCCDGIASSASRVAYAALRNPCGHREVAYDDVTEASEAAMTASLLMRMLDRTENRTRPARRRARREGNSRAVGRRRAVLQPAACGLLFVFAAGHGGLGAMVNGTASMPIAGGTGPGG